jgi:hypothetical protein
MANGIPVRLSEGLTARAREAAAALDRSLTDQVEHWARLGQIVEATISGGAIERLKARSHDASLPDLLAAADTAAGRARAAKVIRERNPIRHGVDSRGELVRTSRTGGRTKKRSKAA